MHEAAEAQSRANEQSESENIDPSLSVPQSMPGLVVRDRARDERRLELQREAAKMRDMLAAKEKELADLG